MCHSLVHVVIDSLHHPLPLNEKLGKAFGTKNIRVRTRMICYEIPVNLDSEDLTDEIVCNNLAIIVYIILIFVKISKSNFLK